MFDKLKKMFNKEKSFIKFEDEIIEEPNNNGSIEISILEGSVKMIINGSLNLRTFREKVYELDEKYQSVIMSLPLSIFYEYNDIIREGVYYFSVSDTRKSYFVNGKKEVVIDDQVLDNGNFEDIHFVFKRSTYDFSISKLIHDTKGSTESHKSFRSSNPRQEGPFSLPIDEAKESFYKLFSSFNLFENDEEITKLKEIISSYFDRYYSEETTRKR